MPRIETYQDAGGEFRCRVIADNGETVMPLEGHTSPGDAERAFLGAHLTVTRVLLERAEATGAPFTRVGEAAVKPNGK